METHEQAGGDELPSVYGNYLGFFYFVSFELAFIIPVVQVSLVYIFRLQNTGNATHPLHVCTVSLQRGVYRHARRDRGVLLCPAFILIAFWYAMSRSHKHRATSWKILKALVFLTNLVLPAVTRTVAQAVRCQEYELGDEGTARCVQSPQLHGGTAQPCVNRN